MSNYFNGRGTVGFTCDVCGRELNCCHILNGMSFCEKCYQETFGKDNQKNEIQQLKQQLVEKEKELAYMTKQAKKFNNEAQKYYEDAYCNSFQNQKAIAELEKLKEEFNGAFSFSTQQEMFDKYIDKQIKELKGE